MLGINQKYSQMSKLDQIKTLYRSAIFYRDHGTQKLVMNSTIGYPNLASSITFQTEMKGKGQFHLSYTKLDGKGDIEMRGIIIKEQANAKAYSKIEYEKADLNHELYLSFKEAIAMHMGVSNQISYIVPSLIYGKELTGVQIYEGTELLETEVRIDGAPCVLLSVKKEIQPKPIDITSFKAFAKEHKLNEQYVATLEKNKERLQQLNQEAQVVEEYSRYYFRLRDLLLIKQEKTMQIGEHKYEFETHYKRPELY